MARLRVLACLLVSVAVLACGQAHANPNEGNYVTDAPEPSPAAATATPTSLLTPGPNPEATWVWTSRAVELKIAPAVSAAVQVHLGPNFPLALTGRTADMSGEPYVEAAWGTLTRVGKGWLPVGAVSFDNPDLAPSAGIDALDADLQEYLAKLGARVAVHVLDVTRGMSYGYNATRTFAAASSIKVPIMMTFLDMKERQRREPSPDELALLTSMIEQSDNEAAIDLYRLIGAPKSITAYMQHLGVVGVAPAPGNIVFGLSPISPAGMVSLLDKLRTGEALNEAHTRLALNLMTHVIRSQQVGVGDTRPPGSIVAMKDGWHWFDPPAGTVMNTSGIVTTDSEVYIISVYTDRNKGLDDGWAIVRHVCSVVARLLAPPARPY